MVPDRRTEWTDGRRQNYIPQTSSGDKKVQLMLKKLTLVFLTASPNVFSIKLFISDFHMPLDRGV